MTGPRRARPRRALLAGVAVVVAAAGSVVAARARGGGDPPAPLPLAGYTPASTQEYEQQLVEDLPSGAPVVIPVFRYVAAGDLPDLGGKGPAYRVTGDPGRADFDRLAEIFGVEGAVDHSGMTWITDTGEEILTLYEPGYWSYARMPVDDVTTARPDSTFGETGSADDGLPQPVDDGEELTPLDGLPSHDEARRIALDLLETTGADLDGAGVTVSPGPTEVVVDVVPRHEGMLMPDAAMFVAVGVDGRIRNAAGRFAGLDALGDYPLVDTPVALERLNTGWDAGIPVDGGSVATSSDPPGARAGTSGVEVEVRELPVVDVDLVLMSVGSWDGDLYVVPGYRVVAEDGSVIQVTALPDHLIDPRDTTSG